ncbi:MAG TPA: threonine/serine dehydratase [Gaiellaceae bacterium]|nr:threonine/serine dehydratase [Gaiellaceae bacterium]
MREARADEADRDGATTVSLDDVERAREAIGGRLHRTPAFTSRTLSELTGAGVRLKAELFQRTGSFKPRGVLTNLAALSPDEKARGVIGISAGNHAAALAYGAALEDISALLVMWQGASEQKIEATRAYGADVDLAANGPGEAFDRLAELTADSGRTLVHPFDSPATIAGQGTVGLELVEDVPDVHVVVVPIGGGGLIAGVATAVNGLRPQARIIGVEPERSNAMRAALEAGEPVRIDPVSVADGLNAPFAGDDTLPIVRELVDDIVLVTEDEIAEATRFLYGRAKLACEPAGAAATAALLAGKVAHEQDESVVLVVSGGNVATATAVAILAGR